MGGKLAVIICFRCFESDFRWYFQWTFLKIKNVGKIKKTLKNVKKRALNKKRKNVFFYIYAPLRMYYHAKFGRSTSKSVNISHRTSHRRTPKMGSAFDGRRGWLQETLKFQKSLIFPTPCISCAIRGFTIEFCNGIGAQKTRMMGLPSRGKSLVIS